MNSDTITHDLYVSLIEGQEKIIERYAIEDSINFTGILDTFGGDFSSYRIKEGKIL